MTNAPSRRPKRILGPSVAVAASLAAFASAGLVPTSAGAAQEPTTPPPPSVTTTPPPDTTPPVTVTPPPESTTVIVSEPTTPPPQPTPQPTTTVVVQEPAPVPARWEEPEREDTQFDDSFDIYVAPGVLNQPFGGEDGIDYLERFDPGYQWGLGLGWFERSERGNFAMGVGGFFDHALINSPGRNLEDLDDRSENVFRAGLELRPGFVLGERLFVNLPIRGGYAARVNMTDRNENDGDLDVDVDQGGVIGVAGGFDLAVVRGLYIGTVAGADFHFFRIGNDHDFHMVTWRAHLGYRF